MSAPCDRDCSFSLQAYDVDNRQFVLFYEAVDFNNVRSIGLAVSEDGLGDWCGREFVSFA